MPIEVTIVVGNPRANSRTSLVASKLVEKLLLRQPHSCEVVELSSYAANGAELPTRPMEPVVSRVAASDVAVFASPTYKATYTGLLKSFLDRCPADGLEGVIAIPVMTGANEEHSMACTFTLAPILCELGAVIPGRGFYFPMTQMDSIDEIVDRIAARYRTNLERLAGVGSG